MQHPFWGEGSTDVDLTELTIQLGVEKAETLQT